MHLLIISILSVACWQVAVIHCNEAALHESSSSSDTMSSFPATATLNGNGNNINNIANKSLLNTIIGNVGMTKNSGVMSNLGSAYNAGLSLNELNAGAVSTGVNTLGAIASTKPAMGFMNGQKFAAPPVHGHALAGLANLGIVVPGVGQRMHPSMSVAETSDVSYGSGQSSY